MRSSASAAPGPRGVGLVGLVARLRRRAPVAALADRRRRGDRRAGRGRRASSAPRGRCSSPTTTSSVVLVGRRGRRRRGARWSRSRSARAFARLVAVDCARTPGGSARAGTFVAGSRGPAELQALSDELAATSRRLARVPRREQRAGGVAPRARRLGLPRPAHPAGRAAGDDRGARGRHGRRPAALPPADPGRGRPDGPDGRRPLRALPHPRRRAGLTSQPVAARRPGQRGARRGRPGGPGGRRTARRAAWTTGVFVTADPGSSPGWCPTCRQRDPAHPGRRHRRDHRPPGRPTASS